MASPPNVLRVAMAIVVRFHGSLCFGNSKHCPKTDIVDTHGWIVFATIGGAAANRIVAPRTTAADSLFTASGPARIGLRTVQVVVAIVFVRAPFPGIPVQVVQADRVWLEEANFRRAE